MAIGINSSYDEDYDGYAVNEESIGCCPYCGSDCLIEYEDTQYYDEDSDIEYESEYAATCTNCGKHF